MGFGRFHYELRNKLNATLDEAPICEQCAVLEMPHENWGGRGLRDKQGELIQRTSLLSSDRAQPRRTAATIALECRLKSI